MVLYRVKNFFCRGYGNFSKKRGKITRKYCYTNNFVREEKSFYVVA